MFSRYAVKDFGRLIGFSLGDLLQHVHVMWRPVDRVESKGFVAAADQIVVFTGRNNGDVARLELVRSPSEVLSDEREPVSEIDHRP
jgi:hypothetical protein